jgi:hypothetical protein
MSNTVVYVMEASTGELVATSNGESIFTEFGVQKEAVDAATELISSSAARIATIRADATGTYSDSNSGISTTVVDYQRAAGTLHHKIVLASYLSDSDSGTTTSGPCAETTPVVVNLPAPVMAQDCPTVAPAQCDSGPATAAVVCITLVAFLVVGLAVFFVVKKKRDDDVQALVKSDAQQQQQA